LEEARRSTPNPSSAAGRRQAAAEGTGADPAPGAHDHQGRPLRAYVTDGEINATLRRGDDVETITAERAAELLAEKRAKGPAPKKRPAKRGQGAAAASTSAPKQPRSG
jgi:DNA topoisomerase-1